MKASGKENEKSAVIFKVHGVAADWPEEGRQKDNWTCDLAMSLTVWERGTDAKLR